MKTILIALCFSITLTNTISAQNIELKDNFFYIDGEKFFVKGVGYELSTRPGEAPWDNVFDADLLHFDMQRISNSGFNTIRTWKELPIEALDIIQQYDIKVLMGLGIWVNDDGVLTEPSFMESEKQRIANFLSYTKNYSNIIGYLMMNEPLPQIIKRSEYAKVIQFWEDLKELIYQEHQGVPVSYANTCNGSFINPDYFDFTTYNAYYYSPVSIYHLHGYQSYIKTLVNKATKDVPLIVSEFGLSVSPTGYGVAYGGNSLDEQATGVINMYQQLINGGAAGGFVFQYADGWWKAGDQYVQDDSPEEYFGLVSFESLDDRYGNVRPVWDSLQAYNSAIIAEPKGNEIYSNEIPVEIFLSDTIRKVTISAGNEEIVVYNPNEHVLSDTITISFNQLTDTTLTFRFFDVNNILVKKEEKTLLLAETELKLPTIQVNVNSDYRETGRIEVGYVVDKTSDLNVSNTLEYIYYPSIDFNEGYSYSVDMGNESTFTYEFSNIIENNAVAITVGAGLDVSFGKFRKRIVGEKILLLMDEELTNYSQMKNSKVNVYPNPASEYLHIENSCFLLEAELFEIYDSKARLIKSQILKSNNVKINVANFKSGLYYWSIKSRDGFVLDSDKLLIIQ